MKPGKRICETLKGIRADIARANDIDYQPTECHHKGDCAGTCPACDSEVRWLERQLRLRQQLGKAVTIAGLSIGAAALASSCQVAGHMPMHHEGDSSEVMTSETTEGVMPASEADSSEVILDGDVVAPPTDSIDSCVIKKPRTMPKGLRGKIPVPPKGRKPTKKPI